MFKETLCQFLYSKIEEGNVKEQEINGYQITVAEAYQIIGLLED